VTLTPSSGQTGQLIHLCGDIFRKLRMWSIFSILWHFDISCQITKLFEVKASRVKKTTFLSRVTLTPSSGQTGQPINSSRDIFRKLRMWSIFSILCHFDVSCQITKLFEVKASRVKKGVANWIKIILNGQWACSRLLLVRGRCQLYKNKSNWSVGVFWFVIGLGALPIE